MSELIGLDRVIDIEPGKRAVGVRNVPNTLSIFDSHFPRKPVLPGVLILGSLAKLGAALLQRQPGGGWRLSEAQQMRFRHFVQPGDQMELTVELNDATTERAALSGAVRVNGQLMVSVRELRFVRGDQGTSS